MSLHYLCFGSFWRNITSPFTHWNRGTAVQIDSMKYHPEMQMVVGELGTDIMVLTMAARITQSIFTLARNLLHRRSLGRKSVPFDWKNKAFQAVLWLCWNILDLLLTVEVTNMSVYKKLSKHSAHHTGQSMNTISIKCQWGCKGDLDEEDMVPEKELPGMENFHPPSSMKEVYDQKVFSDMAIKMGKEEFYDYKVFSDMDIMMSKEAILPSCTNPFILSMICVPSDDESSLPSEESDVGEFESDVESVGDSSPPCDESSLCESECVDEEAEKDSSLEDASVDSGMQESWTPKSKEDMNESEEESDWSDEEDASWDEESDVDSRDDDLWASFCQNEDPYNPLCFAMPTRSPKQQVNKEMESRVQSCPSIAEHKECQTLSYSVSCQTKKPVLSRLRSSHKCAKQNSEFTEELKQTGKPGAKKVRFSSNVTVHHMVTWSYAHRMARKGPWEEYARDHSRFQKRIAETEAAIGFCLEPSHREKIWASIHNEEK